MTVTIYKIWINKNNKGSLKQYRTVFRLSCVCSVFYALNALIRSRTNRGHQNGRVRGVSNEKPKIAAIKIEIRINYCEIVDPNGFARNKAWGDGGYHPRR